MHDPATQTLRTAAHPGSVRSRFEPVLDSLCQMQVEGLSLYPLKPLINLVGCLRPENAAYQEDSLHRVQALAYLLTRHPQYQLALRGYLLGVLGQYHQARLYAESGILGNQNLWAALRARLWAKLLPAEHQRTQLSFPLQQTFAHHNDPRWLTRLPEHVWLELWQALGIDQLPPATPALVHTRLEMLEAMSLLSCRIAAMGLEPELLRLRTSQPQPRGSFEDSPFLRQQVALNEFLRVQRARLAADTGGNPDAAVLAALDNSLATRMRDVADWLMACHTCVQTARDSTQRLGVSVGLTWLLVRLEQHIDRCEQLLALSAPQGPTTPALACDPAAQVEIHSAHAARAIAFCCELAIAENQRSSLRHVLTVNTDLIALQVTEHAGRTGEHYIAHTRSEWKTIAYAAMKAGALVGVMAWVKFEIAQKNLPPLVEGFAFGLNYALGFVLILILHGTLATKQPAMTAAHLASEIQLSDHEENDEKGIPTGERSHDVLQSRSFRESLADLFEAVSRTQWLSIFGNLLLAIPVGALIAGLCILSGAPAIDAKKAHHLLSDLDPFHSFALPGAALAGLCLFLAGLISGYYDNLAIYNHIPQRLRQLRWPWRLLGRRWGHVCRYVENNLGSLAGNFFLGFLLIVPITLSQLLGFYGLDVRHVTLSSASFAYALVTLWSDLPLKDVLLALLGIVLIGAVNLGVSFALALWLALRARGVHVVRLGPLLRTLLRRFLTRPLGFFFPSFPTRARPIAAGAEEVGMEEVGAEKIGEKQKEGGREKKEGQEGQKSPS